MSDKFDGLEATEKAGIGATLNRCRALAAKIANELRKKKPEHFVDESSLADLHASLSTLPGSSNRKQRRAKERSRRRPGASLALYAAALAFDLLI